MIKQLVKPIFSNIFFLTFVLFFLPSCSKQTLECNSDKVAVFIKLPQSNQVFDNVSGLCYEEICNHFKNVGYKLVDKSEDGYSLEIQIKKIDTVNKLVSPDVLLFHSTVRLDLICKLFNYNGELVTEKKFNITTLISKPKDFVMNSEFTEFEYKKLFKTAATRIEHNLRHFLVEQN